MATTQSLHVKTEKCKTHSHWRELDSSAAEFLGRLRTDTVSPDAISLLSAATAAEAASSCGGSCSNLSYQPTAWLAPELFPGRLKRVAHLGRGCQLRDRDAYDAVDVLDACLGQGMGHDRETVCGLGPLVVSLRRCIHTRFWSRSFWANITTTKNKRNTQAWRQEESLHYIRI